jgi:hypothetical protein
MTPVSIAFAVVVLGNGLLDLLGSVYLRRLLPGDWSAPLLVPGSIYLLACTPGCGCPFSVTAPKVVARGVTLTPPLLAGCQLAPVFRLPAPSARAASKFWARLLATRLRRH